MTEGSTRVASGELGVPVAEAWALLSDTPRMIAVDPLLVAYEPERGVLEEGTLNRVTARVGPFRARLMTRTEVLEPGRRAVFVSVRPRFPVRVRAEDTLEPTGSGCRYTVAMTVTATLPVVGHLLAPLIAWRMARQRQQLIGRVREELTRRAPGASSGDGQGRG
ncbi:SRPBCC family protein [Nitriliruptor alkaliphilus]|uniref:SRPBCC family protein n=1 Tax=Nitriliruptor alkaliphilus TaxID=427918 RepID=UPI000697E959|nr:SRPBCC family protein [Nitriliruptor alkaliphilus]